MGSFPAVLDATVLYPAPLRDLLLELAVCDLYRAKWSNAVHEEASEHRRGGWPDLDWEGTRIEVLDALGRGEEAQAVRWSCFERALRAEHLLA